MAVKPPKISPDALLGAGVGLLGILLVLHKPAAPSTAQTVLAAPSGGPSPTVSDASLWAALAQQMAANGSPLGTAPGLPTSTQPLPGPLPAVFDNPSPAAPAAPAPALPSGDPGIYLTSLTAISSPASSSSFTTARSGPTRGGVAS